MLSGEIAGERGEARLLGEVVGDASQSPYASLGFCMQQNALYDQLTVRQHLELFGGVKGAEPHALRERIDYLLKLLKIKEFERKQAKTLSGGTKRKLSFAIALVAAPNVLFLDEPTAGVDVATRRHLWHVMQRAAQHSATVIVRFVLFFYSSF